MARDTQKEKIPHFDDSAPSGKEGLEMKTIAALVIVASVLYILLVLLRFT
jgi:hypothetical protein